MENLFKSLLNKDQSLSSKTIDLSNAVNLNTSITIIKGNLETTFNIWFCLCRSSVDNLIMMDDFDITDGDIDTSIGGIPVDNLDKLKDSLKNSGLNYVAESLEISWEEVRTQLAKEVSNSKLFKAIFGEDAVLSESLEEYEYKMILLEYAIENYSTIKPHHWTLSKVFGVVTDEEGNRVKPALDEIKRTYQELKNNQ